MLKFARKTKRKLTWLREYYMNKSLLAFHLSFKMNNKLKLFHQCLNLNDKTPLLLHLRWGSETYAKHHWKFEDENDCKSSYFPATSWSFNDFALIVIECLIDTPIKMEICVKIKILIIWWQEVFYQKKVSWRMLHTIRLTKQQKSEPYFV